MPVQAPHPLDEAAVAAIVGIADPVRRNVAITAGYHALAMEVAAVLGESDANWLCFGQWASAEAGRAIRGETVPGLLRPLIGATVRDAVAAGNAAVFGDIAPAFVRLLRGARARPTASRGDLRAAADLRDDLLAHPQLAGSEDLARAFTAYVDALGLRAADDPSSRKRRAERMLVANASVGAHEQVVADPHIRAAIPGDSLLAIAATAHLGIRVPDGTLALARDVPPPRYLGGPQFPADLAHLRDPDAIALAGRFRQDLDSADASDAPDWESYEERMGYIFTLLRSYQQDPSIFRLPPDPAGSEAPESAAGDPPVNHEERA